MAECDCFFHTLVNNGILHSPSCLLILRGQAEVRAIILSREAAKRDLGLYANTDLPYPKRPASWKQYLERFDLWLGTWLPDKEYK